MSTTINSMQATTTTATAALTTITKSPENCTSPKTTLVVVAAPSPTITTSTNTAAAGDSAVALLCVAENNSNSNTNTIPISSSSPCNSCSSSLTSWSDVLCANAYCSSSKQQQQIYKNNDEEDETEARTDAPLKTNTTTTTTLTNNTLIIPQLANCQQNNFTKYEQQDTTAFDSGRESVNECDSSLDESINYPSCSLGSFTAQQQRNKKPCTLDFYASSGSQTKWYLPPTRDIVKINVSSVNTECLMTKSCVSIAEPESSVVTPPSDQAGEISADEQDNDITTNDKIYTRTAATTNDGISVIGIRNGFPTNLSHQIRAVSSPSLTSETTSATNAATTTNSIHQRVPSSNSSYTTTSHDDCQTNTNTTNNNTAANSHSNSNTTANSSSSSSSNNQNVGVLQKFKRTLTNFNKHPTTATNHSSTTAASTGVGTPALGTETSTYLMAEGEMQTDVTDGCSTTAGGGSGGGGGVVSNKYRFGPLVWRTSKERRKTKYNRRDKCNSGDSGIQIELENDEQFARVLAAGNGGGVGSIHMSNVNGSLFNRKQEGNNSLRVRAVRRTNSAKVSSIIDENSCSSIHKSHLLKHIDLHNEREAPESLPTRSLSQPNGLESCGMTRNDLDDSDSDSVTSHEEATSYYPIYAEVLYNFTAAGPQELGLEKGTLIEILRKEIGPWWFGRIKKEDASLVEEILDPELGWFPKEFVRVIHSPETDYFYLQHMADLHQHHEQQQKQQQQLQQQVITESMQTNRVSNENLSLNTSTSAPCALLVNTSNSSLEDNCNNTTVIDQHNVTTIVIESSSSSSPPSLPAAAPSSSPSSLFNNLENQVANDATATNNSTNLSVNSTTITTTSQQSTILSTSQSLNVIMDSADILRRSAVKELLDTEVNYVKLLAAICEGYLPAMSKRIDIFSPNSIRLIFSNITAIYKFQRKFLEALRKGIEQNQVAKVFLKMHKGFLCYSTYCNSYPRALIELASYERVKDARTILDNCRETENLAELPLSAHLLAPVQRICRYPLHLGEMIKSSEKGSEPPAFSLAEFEQIDVSQLNIPDTTETIDMALDAMKSVTEAVNEGKRHSETIARHQASFQNFKGPPLHLHSTRFFLQIDATRQKQNLWNSSCTLFLFDNQLVYCKRDIIKRSNFIYKGRIFLDRCRVVNVRDGKMFGHTIKNSLRIYCEARDKWFDFSFRSANRKHRFLNTLALERQFGGKSLYISEMTGFEYAFEERDYSDQSDYEGGDSGEQKLKEFLYETNLNTGNNTNTSGESSVPESPAKAFKYSDTLPHKKSQRLDTTTGHGQENQTGSLGRRRLGNWFRKPKSTASTPNQSPTHKGTQGAHSTGDLQLTGTDLTENYNAIEHNENGGVSS